MKRFYTHHITEYKKGDMILYTDHIKIIEKYKASVRHAQKGLARAEKKIEKLTKQGESK